MMEINVNGNTVRLYASPTDEPTRSLVVGAISGKRTRIYLGDLEDAAGVGFRVRERNTDTWAVALTAAGALSWLVETAEAWEATL